MVMQVQTMWCHRAVCEGEWSRWHQSVNLYMCHKNETNRTPQCVWSASCFDFFQATGTSRIIPWNRPWPLPVSPSFLLPYTSVLSFLLSTSSYFQPHVLWQFIGVCLVHRAHLCTFHWGVLFTGPICAHFTGVCLVYRAHLCTCHCGVSYLQGLFVPISLGCVLFTKAHLCTFHWGVSCSQGPFVHISLGCLVHRAYLCTFHWGVSCLQGPFVHISLGCVLFTGSVCAHCQYHCHTTVKACDIIPGNLRKWVSQLWNASRCMCCGGCQLFCCSHWRWAVLNIGQLSELFTLIRNSFTWLICWHCVKLRQQSESGI
jgi:hypothetical protein